jgi:hypothetical protein
MRTVYLGDQGSFKVYASNNAEKNKINLRFPLYINEYIGFTSEKMHVKFSQLMSYYNDEEYEPSRAHFSSVG